MSARNKEPNKKEKEPEKKERNNIDLDLLEEDDEFEEFPAEEWQEKSDDQELTIWEDDWDDDDIEDDFSKQLRSELEKQKLKMGSM